nr:hypothetical protein [Tanacetum cinerariifolium]
MSDSEHSSVTYTSVPSPVKDYSDIRSPEVNGPPSSDYVPGPEEPEQAPLSPDYLPGPEEPEQAPPSPVYLPYVPKLVYPEYMPPEDNVFPAEEQPLPVAATPTTDSPGYIPEFDPKGDPEEDDEEDLEEDLADYPVDSTVVALPAVDRIPSEEVTKPLPRYHLHHYLYHHHHLIALLISRFSRVVYRFERGCVWGRLKMTVMIEREARMAREAWGLSMDARDNACSDVMSLRTTLVAQHALILDLQAADRRRQGVNKELLAADHKRQVQLTKALRSTPVITTPTTSVTNAQLQAMIDQGITVALAARDANRNGDDSHTSGTGRPVISNSTVACQVKFATCTLQGNDLTWWNSYVKITTPEAAHAMPWRTLKKMMTDKYCPRGEIKKLESEM